MDLKWTGVTEGQMAKHQDSRCTKSERVKLKQQGIPKMMVEPLLPFLLPCARDKGSREETEKDCLGKHPEGAAILEPPTQTLRMDSLGISRRGGGMGVGGCLGNRHRGLVVSQEKI